MYLVIEIQKFSEESVAVCPVITKPTWNEGESEYCRVRSVAAISSVPQHSVIFMNDQGQLYDSKCYTHFPDPAPEEEAEGD